MNLRHTNILSLTAVSLSLLLLFAHNFMPKKRFRLLPNSEAWAYSSDDSQRGGNSAAEFLDSDYGSWHCSLRETDDLDYPDCSINVALAQSDADWTGGMDLSAYNTLEVKFRYRGPAKLIRLHVRNFDENLSTPDDHNSAKFIKMRIRSADFDSELHLQLSDFQLADWWIDAFDVPVNWARPQFDRVTSFGIDFSSPAPLGEHFIEIEKIDFVGDYISAANWYLTILGLWLTGITVFGARSLNEIYKRRAKDAQRIKEMTEYAANLKQESNTYKNLSKTDTLTGALNRFGLQEIIDVSFEWRRADDDIALIIMDIDHFKKINDKHGHSTGDEVLRAIGQLLTSTTRSFDTVARWGGEEFLLLCPHTNAHTALIIAEKIRLHISDLIIPGHEEMQVTASFGVSSIAAKESFVDAFKRADEALYLAKSEGRNRCMVNETEAEKK